MKRFHFRLGRVLNVRRQLLRQAEMRQSLARMQVEAAAAECSRIEGELARSGVNDEAVLRASSALGTWRARYEQAAALGRLLESARSALVSAQRRLEEADRQRLRIAKDVEALQMLRQEQWERHRDAAIRRDQQFLNEVGLERWLRQRRVDSVEGPPGPRESSE